MEPELIDQLRRVCQTNETARSFFRYAASRERNRTETPIDRVMAMLEQGGDHVTRAELIQVFRRLEELGCGRYVEGRHGYASRFAWTINIIDVGRAALGEVAVTTVQADVPADTEPNVLAHVFRLRRDFQAELDLPVDLTLGEADRLAAFIKTLPIEGEQ